MEEKEQAGLGARREWGWQGSPCHPPQGPTRAQAHVRRALRPVLPQAVTRWGRFASAVPLLWPLYTLPLELAFSVLLQFVSLRFSLCSFILLLKTLNVQLQV